MRIQDIGERELISIIHRLQARPPMGYIGIGDDAAFIPSNSRGTLISQDMLVENQHFRLDWMTPEQLGEKAVAMNVSDIAAMAGTPLALLTSLSVPGSLDVAWVESLYRGIAKALDRYGMVLIGGDTVGSQDRITLDVTVVGEPGPSGPMLKTGARPGDRLFVSGRLGASYSGFTLLAHGITWPSTVVVERSVLMAHLTPTARVKVGQQLGPFAHALTDVSDGLVAELEEITRFGRIGAVIFEDRLPIDEATKAIARRYASDGTDFALYGGEDYELLAAIPPSRVAEVHEIEARTGVVMTEIGKITETPGVRMAASEGEPEHDLQGRIYNHFPVA